MLDFAAGIESKNYGLRKTSDLRTLLDSLKILLPLVMIAGALSFRIWIFSQNIQIGYQSHQLTYQTEDLNKTHKQLILEEQTLKDLGRLETIALGEMGMIIPPANRIIMSPPPEDWDLGNSEALAMRTLSTPEMQAPSAFN